jgi:hypothetical protein
MAIKGRFELDVVTQKQLKETSERQASAWLAEGNARESVQRIQARIESGATIEAGALTFDGSLRMVRTRKVG